MNEVELKSNNEEADTAAEMEATATASTVTASTTTTPVTTTTTTTAANMVTQDVSFSQSYPLCPTLKISYCVLDMEPGTTIVGTASIDQTDVKVFFTFFPFSCLFKLISWHFTVE